MKKRRKMKANILLAFIALISTIIAGCGAGKGPTPTTAPAAPAEDVWQAETIEMPQYLSVFGEAAYENTLYFLAYTGEDQLTAKAAVYQMDMSGEQPEPTLVPYSFAAGETPVDLAVGKDGTLVLLTSHQTAGENSAVTAETDTSAGNDASDDTATAAADNTTDDAATAAAEDSPAAAEPEITDVTWKRLDHNGNVTASGSIREYFRETGNPIPYDLAVDGDGNLFFGQETKLVGLNPDGGPLMEITSENDIGRLFVNREGQVCTLAYDYVNGGMKIFPIDLPGKSLADGHSVPLTDYMFAASPGIDADCLLVCNKGVYSYILETETATLQCEWTSIDLSIDYMGCMLPLADGRMVVLDKNIQNGQMSASWELIRKLTPEEAAAQIPKTTLVIGGMSFNFDSVIREAVVDFNKAHDDYRIEIKEYNIDDSNAGYEQGYEQLDTDVATGNAPDILLSPRSWSMENFVRQGALEELYPYLTQDDTVSIDDLQENVLHSFETDGKLYGLPISFRLSTVIGAKSLLGDRKTWNLDEMIAFVENHLDGSPVFDNPTRSAVFYYCMTGAGTQLVNPAAERTVVNRQLLIQLLTFCQRFEPATEYTGGWMDMEQLAEQIADGRVILLEEEITHLQSYQFYSRMFGGPVNFVGYPTEGNSGNLIRANASLAISSSSKHKDVAWEFIRSLLGEKSQDSEIFFGFPIRLSSLEKRFASAMDPDMHYVVSFGSGTMEIDPLTQEEATMFQELIDNAAAPPTVDDRIFSIISEEAEGYFSGSKSVEDVADVVENRVGTYLAEMQ